MKPRHVAGSDAEVLRQRAEQLARRAPDLVMAEAAVLEFSIGAQRCLLELEWVREVRALGELLPIPLSGPSLVGLVQLRGRMLPVFELAELLGIPAATAPATRLLVIGRDAAAAGLAVSEVHGLVRACAADAEQRSAPLEGMRPGPVRGVTREGHLFLDGDRLLALQPGGAPDQERTTRTVP